MSAFHPRRNTETGGWRQLSNYRLNWMATMPTGLSITVISSADIDSKNRVIPAKTRPTKNSIRNSIKDELGKSSTKLKERINRRWWYRGAPWTREKNEETRIVRRSPITSRKNLERKSTMEKNRCNWVYETCSLERRDVTYVYILLSFFISVHFYFSPSLSFSLLSSPCLSPVISHFNQIRSHLRIAVVSRR